MPLIDRETVTDSLKFWEIGRILFNIVLFLTTLVTLKWSFVFTLEFFLLLFILAGAANAAYCVAYPVDLLVQASEWREWWRKWRWTMWFFGTTLAAALTHLILAQ